MALRRSTISSRRAFLAKGVAFAGFPFIVKASVLGGNPPCGRVAVGCIGTGNMGLSNVSGFKEQGGAEVVAVCDVDAGHLEKARQDAGLSARSAYGDFRELLDRSDIDAVVISTPDHWHVPMAMEAVRAGKDVYCEKPLSRTIAEGRLLCNAVKRYARVFQTGSHQRSDRNFRFACELVRNGRIGTIRKIVIEILANNRENPIGWKTEPVPAGLDYDMWLGPAPWAPYITQRCHYSFRFIRDYAGGQLTNWGAHHLDIVQWALDKDSSGPVKISGKGKFPTDGLFNTAEEVYVEYAYENNIRVICRTNPDFPTGRILFEGEKGWIRVSRETLATEPAGLLTSRLGPDEIHLYRSLDHRKDFLDCVKTRRQTAAPAETGHRSATVCHLGNIAMLLGRELRWDPRTESFIGDQAASRMLGRSARSPWIFC